MALRRTDPESYITEYTPVYEDDQGTVILGEKIVGYLKKEIQTPMAQGRSTKIILMTKWIRTSRLSIKHSFSSTGNLALAASHRRSEGIMYWLEAGSHHYHDDEEDSDQ